MAPIFFHLTISALTAFICLFLIHYYRDEYPFPKGVKTLLVTLSFTLSFLFGIFQSNAGSVATYLEMLIIGPLLFLCATDLKALELPDKVNLFIGLIGLIHLFVVPFPFTSGILTAVILFISFFMIALVSGGALGGGDIKYVLAFGLWIPTYLILPFLLFSTLSASLYGIIMLLLNRKNQPLPFGPFLVLSSIYLLFLF